MSSQQVPSPLPSPGVGARRKGPKTLPKLPMSAFTPPTTATSDRFPEGISPAPIQPSRIVDAQVSAPGGDFSKWTQDASEGLKGKVSGVVVSLHGTEPSKVGEAIDALRTSSSPVPILAVLVPFSLDEGTPASIPSYLASPSSTGPKIVLAAVYTKFSTQAVEALQWAIERGFTVDLAIETNLRAGEGAWEDLDDLLSKAILNATKGNIILSNILPPPDDLSIPIIKLLTHPTYQVYQTQIATLSLYSNISIKFTPPTWSAENGAVDVKEWKRRTMMYINPALEAFGFERILWGSSPSASSSTALSLAQWYTLAHEAWDELGTGPEFIDAVFCENAKKVYGS